MPCPQKPQNPTDILDSHTEKGCIHWFDLSEDTNPEISSQKARPYIIIGRNNIKSTRVIISPVSDRVHYVEKGTNKLKYPYHAPIDKSDNSFLDKDSVILLDQVYTIGKDELCEEWYMGKISTMTELDNAMIYNYDLFESIFDVYKQLFMQLKDTAEKVHTSSYSRK